VQKKDGKVVMTITTQVSKDGKTRTSTWYGKNAEGKDVHNGKPDLPSNTGKYTPYGLNTGKNNRLIAIPYL
jgi:hypothetical protein